MSGNRVLGGAAATFATPFLGILPMRDDPELGLQLRYVYDKSPAATAGLKAGDRISKVGTTEAGLRPFSGRAGLANMLATLQPAWRAASVEPMQVLRDE